MHYWWKGLDKLVQNQLSHIITSSEIEGIQTIDLVTGGDHGSREYQMLLKMVPKKEAKKLKKLSTLLHIASFCSVLLIYYFYMYVFRL